MTDTTSLPSGDVTFMFTDIVGSTEMKKKMPGATTDEREDAYRERVKAPHDAIITKCVGEHRGCVVKGTGDGFFIAFANAERAVLCGVGIQREIGNARIFTPSGVLQIRIGLNSGQAKPVRKDYTASAVDKAARVESKAAPGQVYLSGETHALILGNVRGISTASAGFYDLKGVGNEELFIASDESSSIPPLAVRAMPASPPSATSAHPAHGAARIKILYFISYTRDDEKLPGKLLKELRKQFSACKDYELVSWQDTDIVAGEQWHQQIQVAISACHFGLLLVSPAFLGKDYITKAELPYFVTGRKPCIPVGLCRFDFETQELKGLQDFQIFRYQSEGSTTARAFADCHKKVQADFALALYKQIVARLKKQFAAEATAKP